MPTKTKILLLSITIVFLYLLLGEVLGRWIETFESYEVLKGKEVALLHSSDAGTRRVALRGEKEYLSQLLKKSRAAYSQDQAGLFRYLTDLADTSALRIESIVPLEEELKSGLRELGFQLSIRASYHALGGYVNALETGSMPVKFERLTIASRVPADSMLQIETEGCVAMIPGRGAK